MNTLGYITPNVIFVCKSDVMSLSNCDAYIQCNVVLLIKLHCIVIPYQNIPLLSCWTSQYLDQVEDIWLLQNSLLLFPCGLVQEGTVLGELVPFLGLNHKFCLTKYGINYLMHVN